MRILRSVTTPSISIIMFLSDSLHLFLLSTSAVAAPVHHEDVTPTPQRIHQKFRYPLAEAIGKLHLHGAIYERADLPNALVSGFVNSINCVHMQSRFAPNRYLLLW